MPQSSKNRIFTSSAELAWAEVLGSDSHHPEGETEENYPGSHYTWVKMTKPSLEGLRLALQDGGGFSIRRSDESEAFHPFALPNHYIESIEIDVGALHGAWASDLLGSNSTLG